MDGPNGPIPRIVDLSSGVGRRRALAGLGGLAGLGVLGALPTMPARAGQGDLLRIGTAGAGGTYDPVGRRLARALDPEAETDCGRSCALPEVAARDLATDGSVANVAAIQAGRLEAGLVQADVAAAAYHGDGVAAHDRLRAVATLYGERLHLVVRRDADIDALADLANRRVSLGLPGSGTRVVARRVLAAQGLGEADLDARAPSPAEAARALRDGGLDAAFVMAGPPVPAIADLARAAPIRLLPLAPAAARRIGRARAALRPAAIPAGTYDGVPGTPTLGVAAQLLVREDMPAARAYRLTARLLSEAMGDVLADAHPRGAEVGVANALADVTIPLHPGAASWYQRRHMLP